MCSRFVVSSARRPILACVGQAVSKSVPGHQFQFQSPIKPLKSSQQRPFRITVMAPSKEVKDQAKSKGNISENVEGRENEWKFRAPYKVHENLEDGRGGEEGLSKVFYEGGCHCGRIKYQLLRENPLMVKYCHCRTCQVLHGAPFQWAAIFHKGDINFTHGHHDLGWYDSSEKTTRHKLPCKVSCAYCRTPIMDDGRNMILLFPTLIKFKSEEEKKRFTPACHIFYEKRVVDINDGQPKWSGMNDISDLIEDSPPEAIKKRKREIEEAKIGENGDGEKNAEKEKNEGSKI